MYYSLHIYFSILIIARKKVLLKRGMSLDYLITNNGHCKDHSFNRILYAVNTQFINLEHPLSKRVFDGTLILYRESFLNVL